MEITKESYEGIEYCIRCGNKLVLQKDREDKLRPQCTACGWIYYKNPIPASACIVLNEKNELLLIKRKFEPKAGMWALPSGYMEINQTPEECAVDEMQEETGLIGEATEFLGYFCGYSPLYERVLSMGFVMRVTGGCLLAGDDAIDAQYYIINDLPEIAFDAHRYYIDLIKQKLKS